MNTEVANMEKISFIILSWNSEQYIKNCINSINTIHSFLIKIIIVDNGSTDNTVNILKEYKKKNDNLEVVFLSQNIGTTKSRNIALKLVDEDTNYICILDSDTVINENAMRIMTKCLAERKDVAIVGPAMMNEMKQKQIPYRKFPNWKIKLLKAMPLKNISKIGEKMEAYDIEELTNEFECDYLISACWMMRFETYLDLGGLDEKIFYSPEDVEYCMRARSKEYKIVHMKNAQIIHLYQRISKKKLFSKVNFSHLLGLHYVLKKYRKFLKNYKN